MVHTVTSGASELGDALGETATRYAGLTVATKHLNRKLPSAVGANCAVLQLDMVRLSSTTGGGQAGGGPASVAKGSSGPSEVPQASPAPVAVQQAANEMTAG